MKKDWIGYATIEKSIEKEKGEEEPSAAVIRESAKEDTSTSPSDSKGKGVTKASDDQAQDIDLFEE